MTPFGRLQVLEILENLWRASMLLSQPSISQWLRDEKFPAEDKRRVIEAYFGEEFPLTSVIEAMRRLLASVSSRAA